MIGKRYSTQLFGGAPAIVGAPVFVTTSEGGLVAGHVHHVTGETAAQGYRDRVFVAFLTAGGWDDEPRAVVKEMPFYDPKTREEADAMPPGHWCWPRTWQEAEVTACPCGGSKAFADCHGVDSIADTAPSAQDE